MKTLVLIVGMLFGFAVYGRAQIRFEYENKDDKAYTFKMRIGDKRTAYVFESSSIKEEVIETTEAVLYFASKCPEVAVKTGARITIVDGCLRVEEK
jgi:hypothetical protein